VRHTHVQEHTHVGTILSVMADAGETMRPHECRTVDVSPMIYKGGPCRGTIPAIPAYVYLDSWVRVTVPPAEDYQLGHVMIPVAEGGPNSGPGSRLDFPYRAISDRQKYI
jgi:hypothetical protein